MKHVSLRNNMKLCTAQPVRSLAAMNDPAQIAQFLNDKYANVCSVGTELFLHSLFDNVSNPSFQDKCKLLNALEAVGRECRNTQREIRQGVLGERESFVVRNDINCVDLLVIYWI